MAERAASSKRSASVKPASPALVALYVAASGIGTRPATETVLMMTPRPPRAKKYGSTAWAPLIAPTRFTSTRRAWASSGIASNRPHRLMPALLTQTSMPPKASAAVRARSRTAAGSVTSVGTASARPPNAAQARAASSRSARRRAASTTSAPRPPSPRRARRRAGTPRAPPRGGRGGGGPTPMPLAARVTTRVAPRRLVAMPWRRSATGPAARRWSRVIIGPLSSGLPRVRPRFAEPDSRGPVPPAKAAVRQRRRERHAAVVRPLAPAADHLLGRVDRRGGADLVVAEVGGVLEEGRVDYRGQHRADVDAGLVQHLHPQRLGEAAHGELAGRVAALEAVKAEL